MTLEKLDQIVKRVMIAAGILYILAIVAILASCTPMPTATPTPSGQTITATVSTQALTLATPSLTPSPTPTYQQPVNKCRLEKTGRRIADCYKKGINP